MRFWVLNFIAVLLLAGLPLGAQAVCLCDNFETTLGPPACCSHVEDCCMEQHSQEADAVFYLIAHLNAESASSALVCLFVLSETAPVIHSGLGSVAEFARPPPLHGRERRCLVQSWLI